MIHQHTLADYYADKAPLLPPGSQRAAGHFMAWRLEDFITDVVLSESYSRKDFYKVTLALGPATYHYAGQHLDLPAEQHALVFTNTQVPYRWELPVGVCRGYCCVFTEAFLPAHTHLRPADWAVFTPAGQCFFRLDAAQTAQFEAIFEKMLAEQATDYAYKYELLYHYLMECVLGALKLAPAAPARGTGAAGRLAASFQALLAGQFPIVTPARRVELRTAQDFADRLAVHVNHLNRALKEATGRTTTQLIAERLGQEARTLLLHTNWPVGHISHCLGFEEPTHFTQFFRRYAGCTPTQLRQV